MKDDGDTLKRQKIIYRIKINYDDLKHKLKQNIHTDDIKQK